MPLGERARQPAAFRDVVTSPARRETYEAAGLWDGTTLAGHVAHHAATTPGALAVVDAVGRHDYAALAADAAAVATAMRDRGVEAGSVVSVQLPNRYETVVAAVAAQSLGAVINPLLPNYRLHELVNVFRTASPRLILTPGVYRGFDHRLLVGEVVAAAGADEPVHVVVGDAPGPSAVAFESLLGGGADALGTGVAADVSELIFTSGTEARPKAIMHTELNTNFSVRVAYDDLAVGRDDVVWMPSPLGHSTGFNYGLRFALYHGLPLVLQDRWNGEEAADLVARERCSYTLAATTFLQDLVEVAQRRGDTLDSLRLFGCGGAPVPPRLVGAAGERGIQVLRLYGSTEVLVATWNRPSSAESQRRETDGRPMSHVEIEIRDDDDRTAPAGSPGELLVRGPNTCVGYFDDPERTAATFLPDGWVRSGDVLTRDGDDHVTVVARKKEIIIRGGLNIAPREIEDLLTAFPEVERAAVIGLPDERLGERMCACVVLRDGATLDFEAMVSRLRGAGLATYKLPERLEVLPALPATASGKIQKHELVRRLAVPTIPTIPGGDAGEVAGGRGGAAGDGEGGA
jgi:acyl-CoA synthetase (AMP-forming)/AMP-acid ligase II